MGTEKGLIASGFKGKQWFKWLIRPDHEALFLGGVRKGRG